MSQQHQSTIKQKHFKSKNGLDYIVAIKQQGNNATEWWNVIRPADHFIVLNEVFDTMIEKQGYKFDKDVDVPAEAAAVATATTGPEPAVVEKEGE